MAVWEYQIVSVLRDHVININDKKVGSFSEEVTYIRGIGDDYRPAIFPKDITGENFTDYLEQAGQAGWELVCIDNNSIGWKTYYFKRMKPNS